jgi:hypothetical protein
LGTSGFFCLVEEVGAWCWGSEWWSCTSILNIHGLMINYISTRISEPLLQQTLWRSPVCYYASVCNAALAGVQLCSRVRVIRPCNQKERRWLLR